MSNMTAAMGGSADHSGEEKWRYSEKPKVKMWEKGSERVEEWEVRMREWRE